MGEGRLSGNAAGRIGLGRFSSFWFAGTGISLPNPSLIFAPLRYAKTREALGSPLLVLACK